MFESKEEMKEGIINNCSANIPKRRKVDFKINNLTTRQDSPLDCKNFINSEIYHKKSTSKDDINLDQSFAKNGCRLSQEYVEWQLNRNSSQQNVSPNHILLFTVINPSYPITCDVFQTICSPLATVVRVVIFKKNGVQAMVEFQSIEDAELIKQNLHGCDIYSGCCTLKIEYSTSNKNLNVFKNDPNTSWDYSKSSLSVETNDTLAEPTRRVLLDLPNELEENVTKQNISLIRENKSDHILKKNNCNIPSITSPPSLFQLSPAPFKNAHMPIEYQRNANNGHLKSNNMSYGSVCIVYGLNMKHINCIKLFNLFCLYGNVMKIKFLKSKEGSAMVQMGDALAVERIISILHDVKLFNTDVNITYSKQLVLAGVNNPYQLPDGTLSFQDFSESKINRFSTLEMASKNRIQRPSNTLHFFNTPPELKENDIKEIFKDSSDKNCNLISITIFSSKTNRSSSGMVEFKTTDDALEALVLYNHRLITSLHSKHPYTMKLCFSCSSSTNIA